MAEPHFDVTRKYRAVVVKGSGAIAIEATVVVGAGAIGVLDPAIDIAVGARIVIVGDNRKKREFHVARVELHRGISGATDHIMAFY